jgi:hypothetical protein
MKMATAYQRNGRVFLHSNSKTTAGVWIMTKPVLAATSTDATELGRCVISVLNGSHEGIAHPMSWKGLFEPMLQLVGVKTLKEFMKLCKCVEIQFDEERIYFLPTKNLGVTGGFEPLEARLGPVLVGDQCILGEVLSSTFDYAQ